MPTLQSYTQAPGPIVSVSLSFTADELTALSTAAAALPAGHPAIVVLQAVSTIGADPVAHQMLPVLPASTIAGAQAP